MISAVIKYADGRVSIHHSNADKVGTVFEPGFYELSTDSNGNLIIDIAGLAEMHIPFNTKENTIVLKAVQKFFGPKVKETINKLGFVHKLGVLLYGKQGTGKSTIINYIANSMIKHAGAIVFLCAGKTQLGISATLAKEIRKIQDNPIIFVADEFERYAKDSESTMKTVLDGNESLNNSLFLAATNYLDLVPDTLKDRPSRFKIVQEIPGISDKALMREIISETSKKLDPPLLTPKEIEEAISKLEYATLDELKNVCLDKATEFYIPKPKRRIMGFRTKDSAEDEEEFQYGPVAWFFGGHLIDDSPKEPKNLQSNI